MRIQPRDYQIEAVQSLWSYFAENAQGNPLIAMPTGTGKSIVIAHFFETVFQQYHDQKVMCLTHVKELIKQNYEKLISLWPTAPAGIYSSGLNRRDIYNNIIFAGIGSVAGKAPLFGHIDLLLIDEAHLISPNEKTVYQKHIKEMMKINPALRVIGLTATPYRLGHGHLTNEGGIFTDICFDITGMEAFNRLIAEYYLCPLIPMRTVTTLKTDGVSMQGGEFVQKELQNAVNQDEITYAALNEAIQHGNDRKKWLIFTTGVEHTEQAAAIARSLGIRCGAVHSRMPSAKRDEEIAMFKAGEYKAITNNNILTTGFDDPEIDFILGLRPTASTSLWVQMLGRGTRPLYAKGYDLTTFDGRRLACEAGGKRNCLVLDYGANTKRLGPINDPVIPYKKGKGGGSAPVKECIACGMYNHASVRFCANCGQEFVFTTKLKQGASTHELIKGDLPVIEMFAIDHITYSPHFKKDRPDSIKVSYYCNIRVFTEYLCFEHEHRVRYRALEWWSARTNLPAPETTEQALSLIDRVQAATHIRVWTNVKYPEVKTHCFDGSAFGTQEPTGKKTEVMVTKKLRPIDASFAKLNGPEDIEEIPF
jgi:DNA repair protein RadD